MRLEGSYDVIRNQEHKMESFITRYHDNKVESLSRYQDNKVDLLARHHEKSPAFSTDVFPLSPTSPYEVLIRKFR